MQTPLPMTFRGFSFGGFDTIAPDIVDICVSDKVLKPKKLINRDGSIEVLPLCYQRSGHAELLGNRALIHANNLEQGERIRDELSIGICDGIPAPPIHAIPPPQAREKYSTLNFRPAREKKQPALREYSTLYFLLANRKSSLHNDSQKIFSSPWGILCLDICSNSEHIKTCDMRGNTSAIFHGGILMATVKAQVGTPQRTIRGWLVPSVSGEEVYEVEENFWGRWTCSCADYWFRRRRGGMCKHIAACVALELDEEVMMRD
jgi:hypothetical protein